MGYIFRNGRSWIAIDLKINKIHDQIKKLAIKKINYEISDFSSENFVKIENLFSLIIISPLNGLYFQTWQAMNNNELKN